MLVTLLPSRRGKGKCIRFFFFRMFTVYDFLSFIWKVFLILFLLFMAMEVEIKKKKIGESTELPFFFYPNIVWYIVKLVPA